MKNAVKAPFRLIVKARKRRAFPLFLEKGKSPPRFLWNIWKAKAQPGGVYSNMSSHTAMCMQNDRPAARTGGRQRIVEIVKVTASPPSMSASSPAVLSVILPRRV